MKKRKWIWIGFSAFLILSILTVSNPQIRTNIFVRLYHEKIEEGLRLHAGVPADDVTLFGYDAVNTWEGEHTMVEFVIMSRTHTYYGCYYSPDDVPLAFQNQWANFWQDGQNRWKWVGDGIHGSTTRIMEHWYYFEASF